MSFTITAINSTACHGPVRLNHIPFSMGTRKFWAQVLGLVHRSSNRIQCWKKGSKVHIPFPAGMPLAHSETALAECCGGKSCLEVKWLRTGVFQWQGTMEKINKPFCCLYPQNILPHTSIFPVIRVNKFQSNIFARGETRNWFASRGMQSLISQAPEHEPCFTTQTKTPKQQGLLPWFKCFSSSASCFALLYLLRLSE